MELKSRQDLILHNLTRKLFCFNNGNCNDKKNNLFTPLSVFWSFGDSLLQIILLILHMSKFSHFKVG